MVTLGVLKNRGVRFVRTLVVALGLMVKAGSSAEVITDPQETKVWVDAIEAGLINRMSNLVCNIHFQVLKGRAESREDALAGRFVKPLILTEEGKYVKDTRLMTQQSRFLVPLPGTKCTYSVGSVQAESNGGLLLFWFDPDTGSSGDLRVREPNGSPYQVDDSVLLSTVWSGMQYVFSAESFGSLPLRWAKEVISSHDVKVSEHKVMRQNGTTTLYWRYRTNRDSETQLEFSYDLGMGKYPLPTHSLIVSRDLSSRESTVAQETVYAEYIYDHYVPVASGHMPSSITTLIFSRINRQHGYVVTIWKLTENNTAKPRNEDFDAPVPAKAQPFPCLRPERVPPVVDGYRTYNLARMTVEDLDPRCRRGLMVVKRTSGWHPWTWTILGAVVVGVVVVAVGCWAWRNRRSQRSSHGRT